jgi:hypothetical protein
MEETPVRLTLTTSDKAAIGSGLKLKYAFDDVDHPIYGKASNLEGELPFFIVNG